MQEAAADQQLEAGENLQDCFLCQVEAGRAKWQTHTCHYAMQCIGAASCSRHDVMYISTPSQRKIYDSHICNRCRASWTDEMRR